MVRIRKKTSKRGTSHQRAKIRHKVTETHRKTKKEAKKNPQWKSRVKKDPGIPSSLPFKAEILAEIAGERRKAEEEKLRKREAKKAARNGDVAPADDRPAASPTAEDNAGLDGVSSLPATSTISKDKRAKQPPAAEPVDDEAPPLVDSTFADLRAVLDAADAVLHVLDARDPLHHMSAKLDQLLGAKQQGRVCYVLNKIDLVPRESAIQWAAYLRSRQPTCPTVLFRSADVFITAPREPTPKGKGKAVVDDEKYDEGLKEVLGRWAKETGAKDDKEDFTVAVVGLPNSGKSAMINTLLRQSTLPVYGSSTLQEPTTTVGAQAVPLNVDGRTLRIVDTPGYALAEPETASGQQDCKAVDLLVRNKGKIERVKDALPAVSYIFSHAEVEDLMLHLNTPAFGKGDMDAFLKGLARSIQRMKKGGIPDTDAAGRTVLRDWSVGKMLHYVPPPQPPTEKAEGPWSELYERADEGALKGTRTRRELMKEGGLVRMAGEEVAREVLVVPFAGRADEEDEGMEGLEEEDGTEEEAGDEEDEEEEWGGIRESGSDEDEEDSDEESDEEEEDEAADQPPPGSKRKQPASSLPVPSPKKVAFATGSKSPAPTKPPAVNGKANGKAYGKVGKVGNAGVGKRKADVKVGEEAYDFGKFF